MLARMNAPEQPRQRYAFPALSLTLLLILAALVCFGLSEFVLQGWMTKGTAAEWFVGGFIFSTLAKIF